MFVLALMACNDKVAIEDDKDQGVVDEPTEYIYDDEDVADDDDGPTASLKQIGKALDEAIVAAMALDASPLRPAYDEAMLGQSDGCPGYYSDDGNVYWFDACTSDNGSYFSGYAFVYAYPETQEADYTFSGFEMYGAATIRTHDGYTLEMGGSGAQYAYVGDNWRSTDNVVSGTFQWDGDSARDTWLEDDLSPDMYIGTYTVEDQFFGGNYIALDGAIGGLTGELSAASFDELVLVSGSLGWPCVGEPAGLASVRTGDGTWYDIQFDGPDPDGDWQMNDTSVCDGCGTAWYRGEEVGQVCADFSALLDWEDSPWE